MEYPEVEARDCVVIARVTHIEKAEQLFVDEKEPEESVIGIGSAVQSENEIRRIAQHGEDVPGSGDQQNDERAAEGMQALPDTPGKKLAREKKIDDRGADGKNDGDQAFEEQAGAQTCCEEKSPEARARFLGINRAQKCPHG